MTDDWPQIKARLNQVAETIRNTYPIHFTQAQCAADIRAALQRDAAMTQMMQRIAEDVLADPVRYDDLTPEMVRDGFIKAWCALRQRVEELEREKKFAEDNWARAGGRAEAAESAEEGK